MKKRVTPLFFVCMAVSIFHTHVFAGPEKLVKKSVTNQSSTTNPLITPQQTTTGNNGLRDLIRNRLSQNVRAAFFARWNPMQRASFSQITFPAPSTQNTVVVNAVSHQNSSGTVAPFDSAHAVSQIVSRLCLIIGNTSYERLDAQQIPHGIIFTPIFLQDPFADSESESDEVMGEAVEEPNNNQDEMVTDSTDENSDDEDGEIDMYDFILHQDDRDLEKDFDEQDDQED